jgi:hypothetical protein
LPVGNGDRQENESGRPRREPGTDEAAPFPAFAAREREEEERQQDEGCGPREGRETSEESGQGGPALRRRSPAEAQESSRHQKKKEAFG